MPTKKVAAPRHCEYDKCRLVLVQRHWEQPSIFLKRRFCDRACSNKALNGVTKKTGRKRKSGTPLGAPFARTPKQMAMVQAWKERGLEESQRRSAARKTLREGPLPESKFESVEEFVARGGKIKRCEPADAAEMPSEQTVPYRNVFRASVI